MSKYLSGQKGFAAQIHNEKKKQKHQAQEQSLGRSIAFTLLSSFADSIINSKLT